MSLLDFLNTPDAQMGMGLLAAAGPRTDGAGFGQRLQDGMGYAQAQQDNALKRKFQQAQMDNYASEIEARKLATVKDARQQALMDNLFGRPDAGQMPAGGTSEGARAGAGNAGGSLIDIARQLGIPDKAVQADMAFNGGKGISDMLFKRGSPEMTVSNGYAYDKNKLGAGFMPSLSTSTNGQTSMTRIGSDGLPVVSAPTGAMQTYGGYKSAEAGVEPFKVYNPATGREEFTTKLKAAQAASQPSYATEPQMRAAAGGGMGSDPATLAREINATQNSLMQGGIDANSRQMLKDHLATLLSQSGRVGGSAAASSGNFAAGPSMGEAANAKASEAGLIDAAKADVVRDTANQKAGKLYGQLTAGLDRAISLLEQNPTASGAGSMVDGAANFFGRSTKGADVASQLDTVSGWLTANVPRMEGPQSDKDVQSYRIMAAEVGDKTKPVSQRLAAAKELQGLQAKYAELNGGAANTGGAGGQLGDKPEAKSSNKVIDTLPTPNSSNKGQRIRDTTTGKILVSNGLQWKAE